MKTIDGDALMQALEKEKSDTLDAIVRFGMTKCIDIVRNAPAIDDRQEGEWIDYSDEGFVECPFCQCATNCDDNIDELHFCWNCGAKLKKEKST